MKPKQVIVMRKDLNMRKGKMVSQGSHASMGAILSEAWLESSGHNNGENLCISMTDRPEIKEWIYSGSFTKICVSCDSEEAILALEAQAKEAGLMHCLITDSGRTEFGGVPTITALAIGPADPEAIDKITGNLKLL